MMTATVVLHPGFQWRLSLREVRDIATGPACDHCGHAYAMAGDDWCYSCAVAQELDDCRVLGRTARGLTDWQQTVREITLAQAVRS